MNKILEIRLSYTADPERVTVHVKRQVSEGTLWQMKRYSKENGLPWIIGQVIVEPWQAESDGWVKQMPPLS